MSLDYSNLLTVVKHWLEDRHRSYLCKGVNCDFCRQKITKRLRHQASVIIDGESHRWEFGDEVYTALLKLKTVEGWKKFTVIHQGYGSHARDIISAEPPKHNLVNQTTYNQFTSGRYGHLVNQ